jgi:hypothetical protein
MTRLHELANPADDGEAVRAAVDEVTDKDQRPSFGMLTVGSITEACEERVEPNGVAVDIADDVDRTRWK